MVDLLAGFSVEAEPYGFELRRRILERDDEGVIVQKLQTVGYYHSLHSCIEEVIHQLEREAVKNNDRASLEVFLDKLSSIEKTWAERAKNSLLAYAKQKERVDSAEGEEN